MLNSEMLNLKAYAAYAKARVKWRKHEH